MACGEGDTCSDAYRPLLHHAARVLLLRSSGNLGVVVIPGELRYRADVVAEADCRSCSFFSNVYDIERVTFSETA